MLDNCKSAQERWGGVSDLIDKWLHERQQLLIQYCALSELAEDDDDETTAVATQRLCQIMVDYTSVGHFEVYDQLVREGEDFGNQKGLAAAASAFKTVDKTTEQILDFNDKYQETDDLGALLDDLSDIGEVLAHRFEAEDKTIELLHLSHRDRALEGVNPQSA